MRSKSFFMLVAACFFVTSCGGSDERNAGETNADCIREFEVNQSLIAADRNYRMEMDYGTVYLDLSTSVQWPEKIGDENLAVLRDSIVRFAYCDTSSVSIRGAIEKYISDTSFVTGVRQAQSVDSIPSDSMTYFNKVTVTMMEIDRVMATYNVSSAMYLGGAHPTSSSRPFTYDFSQGKVVGLDNMFMSGVTVDSIMPVIKEALARQLSVPVSGLEGAGIFVNQLTFPGKPYIADNTLYFHYDPYEIGPYSLGPVDVAVYPYEIDRFITPAVRRLFDDNL